MLSPWCRSWLAHDWRPLSGAFVVCNMLQQVSELRSSSLAPFLNSCPLYFLPIWHYPILVHFSTLWSLWPITLVACTKLLENIVSCTIHGGRQYLFLCLNVLILKLYFHILSGFMWDSSLIRCLYLCLIRCLYLCLIRCFYLCLIRCLYLCSSEAFTCAGYWRV